MKKTFLTAISLQGFGDLEKGIYKPDGFVLEKNRETSFPIIPVISENLSNIEDIKIIALRTENSDVRDNFKAFLQQLEEMGIQENQVVPITVEENQSKVVGLSTLIAILDEIPDESLIYADITYGTKPMAVILLYALNFIEKIKETEVAGIFYGELPRAGRKSDWSRARLYDLTAYKYLLDVVEQLRMFKVTDIREALRKITDM